MIPAREPVPGRTKLEIRGLQMTFRAENEVRVLEDIDLEIREGEFVCISSARPAAASPRS
jgi:hypothetical protein